MLKILFPEGVKVKNTIDDVRLGSNLTIITTIKFTEKIFLCTILGFTESHSGVLVDMAAFAQMIPGTFKSDKLVISTGIDKVHLKTDCINGAIVNGVREPILYSYAHSSPPGYKRYNQVRVKLFKKDY